MGRTGRATPVWRKRLGFDTAKQVQDPLFDTIGNSGTAALPMMMASALGEANPAT